MACTGAPRVGPSQLRLLTNEQYAHAVRDLLAPLDVGDPTLGFPADAEVGGFRSNADVTISDVHFETYMATAGKLADRAVTEIDRVLGCDRAREGDDACARRFIQDFGRRAFRRPLADEEVQRLAALHATGKAAGFANGVRLVIAAVLQSPHFLYHLDAGLLTPATDKAVPLDGYQVAARLAFFLWGSIPDRALLDAAAAGKLATREGVAAEAARLLADPKAGASLAGFHRQWLVTEEVEEAQKDRRVFSAWTPALATALGGEADRFAEHLMREGDGKLGTLLLAGYTFATGPLYALYGVPDPGPTAPAYKGFRRVELGAGQRSGLLTGGAFLASHAHANQTSPVHRGKVVREQLLCQPLPQPPANAADNPPGLDPRLSTRERFEKHRSDPACSGCHQLMDPIGVGFEAYDGIGRYREVEPNGARVDTVGELIGTRDVDGRFRGAVELARRLAGSAAVHECVATKWLRYALGRLETADDDCTRAELAGVLAASGQDLRQLVVALTRTDAFRHSRATEEKRP
jgi:hypothetical protein